MKTSEESTNDGRFWVSIANEYSEVLCVDVQLECL
jgi:hypothetical protein